MKALRIFFYNAFSNIYDTVIALHSRDPGGDLRREFVSRSGAVDGDKVLDLCTGTGSTATEMAHHVGERGIVVGVDFSRGMLRKAHVKSKQMGLSNMHLVEATVNRLPFRTGSFCMVTFCYALYELKDSHRHEAFQEVRRVLTAEGKLLIMEHETPSNVLIRFLFYLRIIVMGSFSALRFIRNELPIIKEYFPNVAKHTLSSGKSKIINIKKN